jgi:membrane protein involved in colicin uptake
MPNDAEDPTEPTQDGDGSPETGTPTQTGSTPDELVASYRKRQAGAEAARQAAEAKAADLAARLAKYEQEHQSAADKDLSELAATKARLEDAEKRAAEAEAKAEARVLDAKFPNARKELPEVTDPVRLAKFEAMLADGDEPPTPLRHNESKTSSTGSRQARPETAADIRARLEAMPLPEGWN